MSTNISHDVRSSAGAPNSAADIEQVARARERGMRAAMRAEGLLGVMLVVLVVLAVSGLGFGFVVFAISMVLALMLLPAWVGIALWMDRFEPEPPRLLARSFLWGAGVAILIAGIGNTFVYGLMLPFGERAADLVTVVVAAPLVEEGAKAMALLWVYRNARATFGGPLDGVVHAFMVGLGFATVEDAAYYAAAMLDGGAAETAGTFVVRGVITPLAHPLFTSMFGLGLGLAAARRHQRMGRVLVWVGFALAVGAHALWNLSASLGPDAGMTAYLFVFVPLLALLFTIVGLAMRRERRIVTTNLQPELNDGLIDERDLHLLVSRAAWARTWLRAMRRGSDARLAWSSFQQAASDLAFLRHYQSRGVAPTAAAGRGAAAHPLPAPAGMPDASRGAAGTELHVLRRELAEARGGVRTLLG